MTDRERAIEQAAKELYARQKWAGEYIKSFIEGAKWADKNPPDSRMAMKIEHRCQDLEAKLKIATEALEALVKSEVVKSAQFITYSEAYLNAQLMLQRIRE